MRNTVGSSVRKITFIGKRKIVLQSKGGIRRGCKRGYERVGYAKPEFGFRRISRSQHMGYGKLDDSVF
jgi:hypothetical protein